MLQLLNPDDDKRRMNLDGGIRRMYLEIWMTESDRRYSRATDWEGTCAGESIGTSRTQSAIRINKPTFTAWNGIQNVYFEEIRVLQAWGMSFCETSRSCRIECLRRAWHKHNLHAKFTASTERSVDRLSLHRRTTLTQMCHLESQIIWTVVHMWLLSCWTPSVVDRVEEQAKLAHSWLSPCLSVCTDEHMHGHRQWLSYDVPWCTMFVWRVFLSRHLLLIRIWWTSWAKELHCTNQTQETLSSSEHYEH